MDAATDIGCRTINEDEFLACSFRLGDDLKATICCVMDGHAGDIVAKFIAAQLPKVFLKVVDDLKLDVWNNHDRIASLEILPWNWRN